MKEFLVTLAPAGEGPEWVAQWQIQETVPNAAVRLTKPVSQTFDEKTDAVRWLAQEGVERGFTALIPADLETRGFVAVAIFHGH